MTPSDALLRDCSMLALDEWAGWDGSGEYGPLPADDAEDLVQVERRGPGSEHFLIAEGHKIDWAASGGREDVLRWRRVRRLEPVEILVANGDASPCAWVIVGRDGETEVTMDADRAAHFRADPARKVYDLSLRPATALTSGAGDPAIERFMAGD